MRACSLLRAVNRLRLRIEARDLMNLNRRVVFQGLVRACGLQRRDL